MFELKSIELSFTYLRHIVKMRFVIHEYFEALGAYESWAGGRKLAYIHLHDGDILPESPDNIDFFIAMGGLPCP